MTIQGPADDATSQEIIAILNQVLQGASLPTRWEDLRIPGHQVKLEGTNNPTFDVFASDSAGSRGVFAYMFASATENEVFFNLQLPHAWKEGSTLKPHVHWAPTSTDTGFVLWQLEYSIANLSATFSDTVILEATATANGTARFHQLTELGEISAPAGLISSMLLCRLSRRAASDTYADRVAFLEFDLHFQLDEFGSQLEYSKWR